METSHRIITMVSTMSHLGTEMWRSMYRNSYEWLFSYFGHCWSLNSEIKAFKSNRTRWSIFRSQLWVVLGWYKKLRPIEFGNITNDHCIILLSWFCTQFSFLTALVHLVHPSCPLKETQKAQSLFFCLKNWQSTTQQWSGIFSIPKWGVVFVIVTILWLVSAS